jgi:PAS domain S-box-containing protein
LIKTLLEAMRLDLIYVSFDRSEEDTVREARSTMKLGFRRIEAALQECWGEDSGRWPRSGSALIGNKRLSITSLPLTLAGQDGVLVAGSHRSDFPTRNESSILGVAANQLLFVLHEHPRKQAEQTPSPNERDFRALNDIPGMVAIFSATGETQFVNRQILDFFGGTRQDHEDWKGSERTHPEDTPRAVEAFKRAIASGQPFDIEIRARRFDGAYRWVRSRGTPLKDARGRIVQWCNLLVDIDDRKRAEEARAVSETNLRLIVDSIPGMVAVFSPTGELEAVNSQVLNYYGATLEDLKRWESGGFTHPEDNERDVETFTRMIASGEPAGWETRSRRHDGVYRWFQSRCHPLKDEHGRILRWYNLLTDIDDRKKADEALRARERDLNLTINAIPTLIQVSRPDGSVLSVNQAVMDYYGASLEDMRKPDFRDRVYHPDDIERLGQWRKEALKHPVPFEYEQRARAKDGSYRWFLVRYNPLLDEQGRIARWYVAAFDVDDRKRAEESLKAREAELRHALTQLTVAQQVASVGSFTTDLKADTHVWSDEFYRICEFEPGSRVTLQRVMDIVHPEDLARVNAVIEQSLLGKESAVEFRIVTHRGIVKHLRSATRLVEQEGGQAILMGAVQDVTDRILAEATLKAREVELQRVLNHLNEAQRLSKSGSVTADLIKNEHLWSDELYRICEFEIGKEIKNPTMLEVMHPEDVPIFQNLLERCFAGEDPEFEFRIITRSGRQKYLHGIAHRIEHTTKEAMFVGAMQDVTAERLAEQALNRARSELAHVSRVMTLGTLTASIAHEINQPLSGIIMNVDTCQQMLEVNPPNLDVARVQVQRILRDANRAAEVIKHLRSLFSRNQKKSEPVDLADAAREVLALSSSELQRQGVVVRTAFEESLPSVKGDRIQLQQVILNLILNAADAMSAIADRPRVLTVASARETGADVRCSVSDTGIGVDSANVEKLFEAFHTTKSHGMGIGLSISRTIIENHEGKLWAIPNEEGPGATFSFRIPVSPQSVVQHPS